MNYKLAVLVMINLTHTKNAQDSIRNTRRHNPTTNQAVVNLSHMPTCQHSNFQTFSTFLRPVKLKYAKEAVRINVRRKTKTRNWRKYWQSRGFKQPRSRFLRGWSCLAVLFRVRQVFWFVKVLV